MSRVYAYDAKLDREVEFESKKPHCDSCFHDEEAGFESFSSACCCTHDVEYEDLMKVQIA